MQCHVNWKLSFSFTTFLCVFFVEMLYHVRLHIDQFEKNFLLMLNLLSRSNIHWVLSLIENGLLTSEYKGRKMPRFINFWKVFLLKNWILRWQIQPIYIFGQNFLKNMWVKLLVIFLINEWPHKIFISLKIPAIKQN